MLSRSVVMSRLILFVAVTLTSMIGCRSVPNTTYRQTHYRAYQYWQANRQARGQLAMERGRNQQLMAQQGQLQQEVAKLNGDRAALEKKLAGLENDLGTSNDRLVNLKNERGELQRRYVDLLNRSKGMPSPLTPSQTRRFQELADRYPNFDFDPETGVGKFHSDVLFAIGRDEVRDDAHPVLKEFVQILNEPDSTGLHILVVGHTDDRQIAKMETRDRHPTNWHLSTNRANSVVTLLSSFGLADQRMGAAGYSKFQPVLPNSSEDNRTRNRRVEIFILAPEATVAGWDPETRTE